MTDTMTTPPGIVVATNVVADHATGAEVACVENDVVSELVW